MVFSTSVEQLRAHLLMLANDEGTPVYWLHTAQIYAEVAGRPAMLMARAQTCAILNVKMNANVMQTFYREAGVYLQADRDELLSELKNPVTGKTLPLETAFREGPATFTHTANDQGIFGNTELDQKTTRQMPWTWHSSGSRVWMINEDAAIWKPAEPDSPNIQARQPLAGRILQTWHADVKDLQNRKLKSVPCFKNYMMTTSAWPAWMGDPGVPGIGIIRGMGAKLTRRQAETYPEFIRLKHAHPDFFADVGAVAGQKS